MISALYVLRGVALALAWLAAVNIVFSVFVAMAARGAASRGARRSASYWLGLRLLPAVVSTAFVVLLFAPSYWRYEPRELGEAFDVTLAICAVAGAVLLTAAAVRGTSAWRAASRRMRAWRTASTPLMLDGTTVPAFAVDTAAPFMALAGVLRPRLLITRGILDALTVEELRAGVAHELGHWRAWDNLKRLVMRSAPDLLWLTRTAGVLEARWAAAAEHAADRRAAGDAHARCALASALVKVARLTPSRTPVGEPISTLVDGGEIASRVEELLSDTPPQHSVRRWPLVAAATALAAASYVPLLRLVHETTEVLVHSLP